MVSISRKPSSHPLADIIDRLESGGALLPDSELNLMEVVGILKSYGVVLDAYWRNLIYISEYQIFNFFPFFKYFNGEIRLPKLLRHWWHDRINYEFAEYCMKAMFLHGGQGLDTYLDSPEFQATAQQLIKAKFKRNLPVQVLNRLFPGFLPEHIRQMAYYSVLGQFWRVMSAMFLTLSDRYDHGEIKSIPQVVEHVLNGLVEAAELPLTYEVTIQDKSYEILPKSAGLTFLQDAAVPYVEAVFFRGTPFRGLVSYNAQARQIPHDLSRFAYGALYADPLPVGAAGIPPTLLMQDLRHFLPSYLHSFYHRNFRQEDDLRVQICLSFQKSMFCVTTAAILGLAPHAWDTLDPEQQQVNRTYLEAWMDRLLTSRLPNLQVCDIQACDL